ncbi:hypothetical protein RhiirA5_360996 [Rhizophagus irregularis]|uniref:Phytocyanin domain-containing protein n=2 Tax=Rhizophagus irregularis TaxID=588596 RepID=A0A2N0PFZ7_9GLOM|nr:hypothetical protein RirG_263210 [Rhizophagus irregularis DAOM 197198w]PKC05722.1 hypothetical protein RhiirA5_360996 [Rhizophagus irregularis]UZO17646.1 hypothetical protein OCT59_008993 [Rhizophagus irregularis]GBC24317.1 hypothetical protein RIR_jg687.t1 [Rhizophagus irregularis DAOM 181602=DAOM 197198]CAB5095597.1 unnamed protein product [Rhizophagus irregularis]
MKTSFAAIFFVASLASFAQAADVMVNVGNAKGENVFEPAKVMAMPGDNVVFTWVSGKHSVIETDSLVACAKSAKPNAASSDGAFLAPKTWSWPVPKDATPNTKTWFYCGVPGHCTPGTGGMAGTLLIGGGDAGGAAPAPGGGAAPANGTANMPPTPSDGAAKSSAVRNYQSIAAGVVLSSMCMAAAYVL